MMKKLKLTAAILAMLAALSVNVYADEAEITEPAAPAETEAAGTAEAEEMVLAAEIAFPGMIELNVTSSMSDPYIPQELKTEQAQAAEDTVLCRCHRVSGR